MEIKRYFSVLLALALMLGLVTAMPLTVSAEDANTLTAAIANFDHGGTGKLTAVVSGSAVTVTGNVTGVTNSLWLEIDSGVTVIWEAGYSGAGNDVRSCLIFLYGSGAFEVAAGGNIKNTGYHAIFSEGVAVTVSGGKVENAGGGCAIYSEQQVAVSGGTVSDSSGLGYCVIQAYSLKMNGGMVTSGGEGVVIQGGSINISGGKVENTGKGSAINGRDVNVSGGTVSAKTGDAIYGSNSVAISGGFVFAYGADIDGVAGLWLPHYDEPPENVGDAGIINPPVKRVPPEISGTAVVCAWNQEAGNTAYTGGTTANLTASPAGTAKWGRNGVQSGISYDNGTNSGFFSVDGVTVAEAPALSSMSNFVPANSYESGQFTDVDGSAWYSNAIAGAYKYGLMKGSSDTAFNPTGNIKVAEAVTVAARVHSIYSTGEDNFKSSDPWYKVYVDYAIANGIIAASDFTDYNRAATRAEMAYIFSRSVPEFELTPRNIVNSLPDVNSGTPHYNAIIMLYKAGVLAGNDDAGMFSPGNNIIRAEAAAIISRVILPATRMSGKTFGD